MPGLSRRTAYNPSRLATTPPPPPCVGKFSILHSQFSIFSAPRARIVGMNRTVLTVLLLLISWAAFSVIGYAFGYFALDMGDRTHMAETAIGIYGTVAGKEPEE